jgi:hypothetical protein
MVITGLDDYTPKWIKTKPEIGMTVKVTEYLSINGLFLPEERLYEYKEGPYVSVGGLNWSNESGMEMDAIKGSSFSMVTVPGGMSFPKYDTSFKDSLLKSIECFNPKTGERLMFSDQTIKKWGLIENRGNAGTIGTFIFRMEDTAGRLRLIRWKGTPTTEYDSWITSAGFINTSDYQFIGVKFDGTEATFYNGLTTETPTKTTAAGGTANYNFKIGYDEGTSSSHFPGSIKIVGFFKNNNLSNTEITEIYNAGKDSLSPIRTGLAAEYSGRYYEGTAAVPTSITDTAGAGEQKLYINGEVADSDVNYIPTYSGGTSTYLIGADNQLIYNNNNIIITGPILFNRTLSYNEIEEISENGDNFSNKDYWN